ncbi:MAG: flagellar basal body-associated FliL family protein [Calditrichia bacterium]
MPELDDEQRTDIDVSENGETTDSGEKKSFSLLKIGIPLILIQILVAYFLANNVIVPRLYGDNSSSPKTENFKNGAKAEKSVEQEKEKDFGKIFRLEDVIVNPAESRGMQFVLINFGFEVKTDEDLTMLADREVQIRDVLIKILSAKTLPELDGPEDKEALRKEIIASLKNLLPARHLMHVYFSNYIIQ